jgi:hypothetical protein
MLTSSPRSFPRAEATPAESSATRKLVPPFGDALTRPMRTPQGNERELADTNRLFLAGLGSAAVCTRRLNVSDDAVVAAASRKIQASPLRPSSRSLATSSGAGADDLVTPAYATQSSSAVVAAPTPLRGSDDPARTPASLRPGLSQSRSRRTTSPSAVLMPTAASPFGPWVIRTGRPPSPRHA